VYGVDCYRLVAGCFGIAGVLKDRILLDCPRKYHFINDCPNAQIAKELKITLILDKLLEYKRNWIQHVNRMPRNRLPRVKKHYSPTGRRNHGRPLKRILDA
jgi:hypothetical protein